jgi:hypothetical protein
VPLSLTNTGLTIICTLIYLSRLDPNRDAKVKGSKLQTFRVKFEQLKMKEDENIASYFLRVDEEINAIKVLVEEMKETIIFQKVLRYLPMIYDSNISSLEERKSLDTLSMDELHGILTTYEMRTEQDSPVTKEETFMASKKIKKKDKHKPKSYCSCNDDLEEDEEITKFIRRLKKGTKKYKGKLPLICFNCDVVGHLDNKCPYKKNKINEEEDDPKENSKG